MNENKQQLNIPAREAAYLVLWQIDQEAAYANLALQKFLREHSLIPADARLATEIVYGASRMRAALDHMLSRLLTRPLEQLMREALIILRLSLYQLHYLDKAEPYAVVNEAVLLTKKFANAALAGLVNGVLRNYLRRDKRSLLPDQSNLPAYLNITQSYPQWLVDRLLRQYSPEQALAFCCYGNERPGVFLRTNTRKLEREQLRAAIVEQGGAAEIAGLAPETLRLEQGAAVLQGPLFRSGCFTVQGAASQLAAHALNPAPGSRVIDLCAAPGGKTTHLAALMENRGELQAFDLHQHKLPLIMDNCRRLGINIVQAAAADGTALPENYREWADYLLLDAPCSGLGVLNVRPDSRWHKREEDIPALAESSFRLLEAASAYVRPGGYLCYSTCTVTEEENGGNISRFPRPASRIHVGSHGTSGNLAAAAGGPLPSAPGADTAVTLCPGHGRLLSGLAQEVGSMSGRPDLRSLDLGELTVLMKELGQPVFRAKQIFRQVQKHGAVNFDEMTDLPFAFRNYLAEVAELATPREIRRQISADGEAAKLLLELADGVKIEMALMLYRRSKARDRATCCVSSQSGCAMGCRFCATGLTKDFRNLTAGEIVAQAQAGARLARELGLDGLTNIVYMGMGEPLANPEAVYRSIRLLNDAEGLDIGARRITVSTCGLVPQIYQMIDWKLQISLAVSLHTADPEQRRQLMPAAGKYSLTELIQACREFRERTGRRVTCEYAMFAGLNDSPRHADLLANLLTGTDILVNIIPANPVPELGIYASAPETVARFQTTVEAAGVATQLRERRGADIEAACGQLRRRG